MTSGWPNLPRPTTEEHRSMEDDMERVGSFVVENDINNADDDHANDDDDRVDYYDRDYYIVEGGEDNSDSYSSSSSTFTYKKIYRNIGASHELSEEVINEFKEGIVNHLTTSEYTGSKSSLITGILIPAIIIEPQLQQSYINVLRENSVDLIVFDLDHEASADFVEQMTTERINTSGASLGDGLCQLPTLKGIKFECCLKWLVPVVGVVLSCCRQIKTFHFLPPVWETPDDDALVRLQEGIQHQPLLDYVDLGFNDIKSFRCLCSVLATLPKLSTCNLRGPVCPDYFDCPLMISTVADAQILRDLVSLPTLVSLELKDLAFADSLTLGMGCFRDRDTARKLLVHDARLWKVRELRIFLDCFDEWDEELDGYVSELIKASRCLQRLIINLPYSNAVVLSEAFIAAADSGYRSLEKIQILNGYYKEAEGPDLVTEAEGFDPVTNGRLQHVLNLNRTRHLLEQPFACIAKAEAEYERRSSFVTALESLELIILFEFLRRNEWGLQGLVQSMGRDGTLDSGISRKRSA